MGKHSHPKVTAVTSVDPSDGNTAYKTNSNALQKLKHGLSGKWVKNPRNVRAV